MSEYVAHLSGEDLEWFTSIVSLYSEAGETADIIVRSDGTVAVGLNGQGWVSNRVSDYQ